MAGVTQFNWRRYWSKRVAPHLDKELVQASLDLGMMIQLETWRPAFPPRCDWRQQDHEGKALVVSAAESLPLDRPLLDGRWRPELSPS